VAAILVAAFATMVAWPNLGLPRLVFDPAPIQAQTETLEQFNRDTGSSCSTRPADAPTQSACSRQKRKWWSDSARPVRLLRADASVPPRMLHTLRLSQIRAGRACGR
jgi:hypothetical protein